MNDNYRKQVYDYMQDEYEVLCDYEDTFKKEYELAKEEIIYFKFLNSKEKAWLMAARLKERFVEMIRYKANGK